MVLDGPDAPWNAKDACCEDCGTEKNLNDAVTVRRREIIVCDSCLADRIADGDVAAPEVEEED